MRIERLIDSPFFDENRFKKHLYQFVITNRELKTYDNKYNPDEFDSAWYAGQLMELMYTKAGLYFPDNFVDQINKNLHEIESSILDYMLIASNNSDLEVLQLSTEKKINILISVSSNQDQSIIIQYRKNRDILRFMENYYKYSYIKEMDEMILKEES